MKCVQDQNPAQNSSQHSRFKPRKLPEKWVLNWRQPREQSDVHPTGWCTPVPQLEIWCSWKHISYFTAFRMIHKSTFFPNTFYYFMVFVMLQFCYCRCIFMDIRDSYIIPTVTCMHDSLAIMKVSFCLMTVKTFLFLILSNKSGIYLLSEQTKMQLEFPFRRHALMQLIISIN